MSIEERTPRQAWSRRQADLALLGVACVWGATFVMVKDALDAVGPLTFVAYRFALAALAMLPFVALRTSGKRAVDHPSELSRLIWAGLVVGTCLFAGYGFQTAGLQFTGAGRAGFITGLSVVIVPVLSATVDRQPIGRAVAAGVALATVGLALLSLADLTSQPFAVGLGDLLVLGCAWSFALHILAVGRFAPGMSTIGLTLAQIVVVALLSGVAAAIWEAPTVVGLLAVWPAAAFTGLLCTVVAFAVQTRAQRFTSPTHTALIFSTEPVFAVLFAYLLADERLGPAELAGCALILAGMLLAQLRPQH